jgi:hypothetical protein
MKNNLAATLGTLIILAGLGGCDKLSSLQKAAGPPQTPPEAELAKIGYMTTANMGPQGRKVYSHLEEAKTCAHLELAMRWNRPPNVIGGMFDKQMVYLGQTVPADLPQNAEVFLVAKIEKGDPLVAGGEAWLLRMPDGTLVQAAEMADFLQKQAQSAQGSKAVALEKPNKPGRAFCAQAIYQGVKGKDPAQEDRKIPLFSVLYGMDRDE